MKNCIFTGSFDPFTKGHLDIVERAAKFADKLYVGILVNTNKTTYLLDINNRIELVKKATAHIKNVEVIKHDGLVIDFCKEFGINYIVRGIRNAIDFQYEKDMAQFNTDLSNNAVDTLYLNCNSKFQHISSSLVKEVLKYNGDVYNYIPEIIYQDFLKILKAKGNVK